MDYSKVDGLQCDRSDVVSQIKRVVSDEYYDIFVSVLYYIIYLCSYRMGDKYDQEETNEYLSDIDADNKLNRATPPASGGDKRRDQLFHWCIENDIEPAQSSQY